ncbi:hypothetical protein [Pseudomonas aeruginosa]|uniref:hypothetical protein n=2 Tax=Gammaproteobacteria TaxID=1236 RepID=UPI001F49ADC9|nr:hypothetical protein [Pseudomonas aeruginosa]
MNKANECTCPSGDGSLVHPCPAHPAVEQVGGDERAVDGKPRATKCPDCGEGDLMPGDLCACGYETDPSAGYACSECDGSGDGYVGEVCRECDGSGWFVTPEQARAALAHDEQEQAAHELRLLANALGECIQAAGITAPGVPLTGPQLLMFAEDLKRDLQRSSLAQPSPKCNCPGFEKESLSSHAPNCPVRASTAQPSPAGEYGDAYQGAREDIAIWKRRALEAEQALRQAHNGQTFMGEPLVQPYEAPREKVNALFKVLGFSGTASVGDILDAALERLQAQPSPAQAEQAEAERPEGPTEDELEAAGLGYPLHKEEAVKLWYSGFRSEVITVLEAWEAIGHDIGMNPDKGELLDSLRYMLEKCEAHDAALARVAELEKGTVYVEARQCDECQHVGINDSATGVAACHECDWTGPEPEEDRCPGCQRENCMAAACPQCGARYVLVASEEIAAPVAQAQHSVPVAREQLERLVRILDAHNYAKDAEALMALLAAAPAQAQHSVPELLEWAVGRWHAEVSLRPLINVHRRALDDTWRQVIRRLGGDTGLLCGPSHDELLAAAPGTEVPQAWLDVQAERRRQITAEGWTPDHDDLYCAAELPRAAAAYILSGANDEAPAIWPFSAKWWKTRDARANYMRAGALILAEIERLDRAAAAGKEVGHE